MADLKEQPPVYSITGMAFGGRGIARTAEGQVLFVEDALEGDEAEVKLLGGKGRYRDAALEKIVQASPWRQQSQCVFSERCGGCQWQEFRHERQHHWKKHFVLSALQRIGKVPSVEDVTIEVSPSPVGYRFRVLLRGRLREDGRVQLGYFRKGSHEFVAIDRCQNASARINDLILGLESVRLEARNPKSFRVEIQEFPWDGSEEVSGAEGTVLTFFPAHPQDDISGIISAFEKMPGVLWCGGVWQTKTAPFFRTEVRQGISYFVGPNQFQQANPFLNHKIRLKVQEIAASVKPKRVLDLFCGNGNFSLALLQNGVQVTGIEVNPRAIEAAQESVRVLNGEDRADYRSMPADKYLWQAEKERQTFDLVIVDPPREGMWDCLKSLNALRVPSLIYISCDPSTLARDLGVLFNEGYSLKEVTCYDLFPNTFHVETLVFLQR